MRYVGATYDVSNMLQTHRLLHECVGNVANGSPSATTKLRFLANVICFCYKDVFKVLQPFLLCILNPTFFEVLVQSNSDLVLGFAT